MVIDPSTIPDVCAYLDHRVYLGDVYQRLKERNAAFSFRFFSRVSGFSSPNFLKLVILGQRNLSAPAAKRIGKALKLTSVQQRYFELLVEFGQSGSAAKRTKLAQDLLALKADAGAKSLDGSRFKYFLHWYLVVIREWVLSPSFSEDPKWIAEHLEPKISHLEAAAALEVLVELKLIQKVDGRWTQCEGILTTGDEATSAALAHWHQQMLAHASASIDRHLHSVRELQAYTTLLSRAGYEELVNEIRSFQRRIWAICEQDQVRWEGDPGRVYQIGFQVFPLTAPPSSQIESASDNVMNEGDSEKRSRERVPSVGRAKKGKVGDS